MNSSKQHNKSKHSRNNIQYKQTLNQKIKQTQQNHPIPFAQPLKRHIASGTPTRHAMLFGHYWFLPLEILALASSQKLIPIAFWLGRSRCHRHRAIASSTEAHEWVATAALGLGCSCTGTSSPQIRAAVVSGEAVQRCGSSVLYVFLKLRAPSCLVSVFLAGLDLLRLPLRELGVLRRLSVEHNLALLEVAACVFVDQD